MENPLDLLDVVALTVDLSDLGLRKGQVGTIVEELGDLHYDVEFSDNEGETYALATVEASNLLRLHHEPASVS